MQMPPAARASLDWSSMPNSPRPDYLSSSRKRLAPQLIFKGGILKEWNKKTAVALNKGFYDTLPRLEEVAKREADIAWIIYDLVSVENGRRFELNKIKTIYTKFEDSLAKITKSEAGEISDFIGLLQEKIEIKLNGGIPPNTEVADAPF
jgi:hypothetical protein